MSTETFDIPRGQVEIWFEFGSPYSYPSVMRIEPLAARLALHVVWRPFLFGPVFKALGWQGSPFLEQPAKMAYMWRDMERICEKEGLPWNRPSVFPRNTLLPMRVAMFAAGEAWMGEFCRAMMLRHFGEDVDINDEHRVEKVLRALGLPSLDILATAASDPVKLALRAQTERAQALGIFGGPTFLAGREMFWGNDRLEDALAHAASL